MWFPMLLVLMPVSVLFHLCELGLGSSVATGLLCSLCVMSIFNLVMSCFSFESWTLALIVPVPIHCIPFTFCIKHSFISM